MANSTLTWEDIKARREPATATVKVCLSQQIVDELQRLEEELAEARWEDRRNAGRLSHESKALPIAQRIKELEAQAAEHEVEFVFREVPRAEWLALQRRHPPSAEDRKQGFTRWHPEKFVPAAIAASSHNPKLSVEDAKELCDTWPEGVVVRMFNAVVELNMGDRLVPRSPTASEVIREAVGSSEQLEPGESLPASSQDG